MINGVQVLKFCFKLYVGSSIFPPTFQQERKYLNCLTRDLVEYWEQLSTVSLLDPLGRELGDLE